MIKYGIIAMLLCSSPASALDRDKQYHVVAGILAAHTAVNIIPSNNNRERWQIGCATAVAVGALKEAIDATGSGTPELADFVATAVGGCLSMTINW